LRWLGRKPAERKRISEIDWNVFERKKAASKLAFLISILSEKVFCDEGLFLLEM
jgi:hypothetical protein